MGEQRLPIARFDGRQILPWRREIETLGDCLDHGRALHVRCGCNPRIVEVIPDRLLALRNPPSEEARLSEFRPWLSCRRCGRRDRVTVEATDHWRGGLIPRKTPPTIYPKAPAADMPGVRGARPFMPVTDPHPRCGGRGKRRNRV